MFWKLANLKNQENRGSKCSPEHNSYVYEGLSIASKFRVREVNSEKGETVEINVKRAGLKGGGLR